jgi:hypothetical protein
MPKKEKPKKRPEEPTLFDQVAFDWNKPKKVQLCSKDTNLPTPRFQDVLEAVTNQVTNQAIVLQEDSWYVFLFQLLIFFFFRMLSLVRKKTGQRLECCF